MRALLLLFMGVVLAIGCTKPNPAVCCVSPNDCAAIGLNTESERPCAEGLVCVDNVCSEVTTCLADQDCPSSLPQCATDGVCVECELAEDCSAELPQCSPARTCVECLESTHCEVGAPVCDAQELECRGCVRDDECASQVCETVTGICVDESAVVYAAPNGANSSVCSQAEPFSITSAFVVANASRETIKLLPGTYVAKIVVTKRITVHGSGATMTADDGVTLTARDQARLRVIGLVIVSTNSTGHRDQCRHRVRVRGHGRS